MRRYSDWYLQSILRLSQVCCVVLCCVGLRGKARFDVAQHREAIADILFKLQRLEFDAGVRSWSPADPLRALPAPCYCDGHGSMCTRSPSRRFRLSAPSDVLYQDFVTVEDSPVEGLYFLTKGVIDMYFVSADSENQLHPPTSA